MDRTAQFSRRLVSALVFLALTALGIFGQAHAGPSAVGSWSSVIEWPFVPTSAAQLPDGRILTWASNETDAFPTGNLYTHTGTYNPSDGTFASYPNRRHDMFCAGSSMLIDGSVLVAGGNPSLRQTSRFDGQSWRAEPNMANSRWYGTMVTLAEGEAFATFAKRAGSSAELWQDNAGWSGLPRASMATLEREQNLLNSVGGSAAAGQWFAFMHLAPNGRVFHAGPTPSMHWFDTDGLGGVQSAGTRLGESRARQFGSSVMFDEGQLLVSGGADLRMNPASAASAMTIDIRGSAPVVRAVGNMVRPRTFHNSVVLPTGEVIVIGGNESGVQFYDGESVRTPEIWNPDSRGWTAMARHTVPRNYHSVALLLQDGRVLSAGGGLCGDGCGANHADAEIFSPPYLFRDDGSAAPRPGLEFVSSSARAGGNLYVKTASDIDVFNLVRLGSTTHANNSDQRFVSLRAGEVDDGLYEVSVHANPNVLVPGAWWLFGVDVNGVPSVGHTVHVAAGRAADLAPALSAIPDQATPVGEAVSLDVAASVSGPATLKASGLPAGLQLANGTISGQAHTAGTYRVTVFAESAGRAAHQTFTWEIGRGNGGGVVGAGGSASSGGGALGGALLMCYLMALLAGRRRAA